MRTARKWTSWQRADVPASLGLLLETGTGTCTERKGDVPSRDEPLAQVTEFTKGEQGSIRT
jgi:hypothetical protein